MPSLKSTLPDGHRQFRAARLARARVASGPEELEGLLRYTLSDLSTPDPRIEQRVFELSGVRHTTELLHPVLGR